MIDRCYRKTDKAFRRYGGRGIRVCRRWRHSFANFYADMGDRPSPKHSIDRKDNDGDYEPSNCRWATRVQQLRNFSRNHRLTYLGETLCIADWAERTGLSSTTIVQRVRRGIPAEQALTKPQRTTKRARQSPPQG